MKRFAFLFAVGAVCAAFAEEPLHVGVQWANDVLTSEGILTNGLGEVVSYQPGYILETSKSLQVQDGGDLAGIIWHAGWTCLYLKGDMTLGSSGIVCATPSERLVIAAKRSNLEGINEKGIRLTANQTWRYNPDTKTRQIVMFEEITYATNAQGVVTSQGGIKTKTSVPIFLDEGVTLTVTNMSLYVLSPSNDCSKGTIRIANDASYYPIVFKNEEGKLHGQKMIFSGTGRPVLGDVIGDLYTHWNPTKIQLGMHLDAEHFAKELVFENGAGLTVQNNATIFLGPEKISVTNPANNGKSSTFPSATYEQTRDIVLDVSENASFTLTGTMASSTNAWTLSGTGTVALNVNYLRIASVADFTGTLVVKGGCVRLPAKSTWPDGMTVTTQSSGIVAYEGDAVEGLNKAAYFVDDTVEPNDFVIREGEVLFVEGNGLTANTKVTMYDGSKIYVGATSTIASPIVLTNLHANADADDVRFFGLNALTRDVTVTVAGKMKTSMNDLGYAATLTTAKLQKLCGNSVFEMTGPGTVVFTAGADWDLVSIKHSNGNVKLTNGTYLPETVAQTHQNGYIRIGWDAEKFEVCDGGYLHLQSSANAIGLRLSANEHKTSIFEVGNGGKAEFNNNRAISMGYYGGPNSTNLIRVCEGGEMLLPDQGGYWQFNEITRTQDKNVHARFEMNGGHLQLGKWMLKGEAEDKEGRTSLFLWNGGRISWKHSGTNPHIMSRMKGVPVMVAGPNCVVDCGKSSLTNCVATWKDDTGPLEPWTFTDEGRLIVSNGTFVFNTPTVNANLATVGGATVELMTKRVYSQMGSRTDWHRPDEKSNPAYSVDTENTMTHDVKKLTVLDNAGGTYLAHTESPVVDATLVIANGGVWPITKTFTNVSWKDLVFADGATLAGTKDTTTTDLGTGTLSFTGTVTTAFASVPSLASEDHPLFKAASVALDGATFTKAPSTSEVSFKTSDTALWFETKGTLLIFR